MSNFTLILSHNKIFIMVRYNIKIFGVFTSIPLSVLVHPRLVEWFTTCPICWVRHQVMCLNKPGGAPNVMGKAIP
jgi:hypothetical protein